MRRRGLGRVVQPEFELLSQGFEIHGLGDTGIAARLYDSLLIRNHRVRCHCKHRNVVQLCRCRIHLAKGFGLQQHYNWKHGHAAFRTHRYTTSQWKSHHRGWSRNHRRELGSTHCHGGSMRPGHCHLYSQAACQSRVLGTRRRCSPMDAFSSRAGVTVRQQRRLTDQTWRVQFRTSHLRTHGRAPTGQLRMGDSRA